MPRATRQQQQGRHHKQLYQVPVEIQLLAYVGKDSSQSASTQEGVETLDDQHFVKGIQQQYQLVRQMYPHRDDHFARDRHKEREREGVQVRYRFGSYNFALYFKEYDLERILNLYKQGFKIEISTLKGEVLQKFTSQDCNINLNEHCLFFINKFLYRKLDENCTYFLTKYNSSNQNHRRIYKQHLFQKDSLATSVDSFVKGKIRDIKFHDIINFPHQKDLNLSQNQALLKMARNALTFIKGPPGTGKTKLIARACILFQAKKMKVVMGTVSNTGMASIMRELVKQANKINDEELILEYMRQYRDGNDDYLRKYALNHEDKIKLTYYNPLQKIPDNRLQPPQLQYYMLKQQMLRTFLKNQEKKKLPDNIKKYTVAEIQTFLDLICDRIQREFVPTDFKDNYRQINQEVLSTSEVIVATVNLAANINKYFNSPCFKPDVCIIDEAGQAKIQDVFLPLVLNPTRLILVGDDKQLRPIIIGTDKVLEETVFDCCQKNMDYFSMLNIQYRMHPNISKFSNNQFYEGKIIDDMSTKELKSQHLLFRDYPCIFIDHNQKETKFIDDNSRKIYRNEFEVEAIKKIISTFPIDYLQNIGIITLYLQQAKLLNQVLCDEVKYGLLINTCDAFQGGEKDYIIVSCVRANEQFDIGYCGNSQRVNVTMTRAKKGLAIVGSLKVMAQDFKNPTGVWAIFAQHMTNQHWVKSYDEILAGPWLSQPFVKKKSSPKKIEKQKESFAQLKSSDGLKQPSKARASKYEHLSKDIQKDEGDDEIESLLAKNKTAKKQLLRMRIFFQQQGGSPLNVDQQLEKIIQLFSTIPSVEGICLRMTPEVFKTFLDNLDKQESVGLLYCELRSVITLQLSSENKRLYSDKLVYDILRTALMVTALKKASL